ncbi:hypothetical protein SODALDRAFT_331650 [Sodiomyces alkalinus F11]|uniref:PPP4R2-domain-containing protein n=1 Tax=Sodiomyces alkalinus (strain CBS 110278 / VKM F-3762 / F11) TaxID=1314773 RepID=A0A3N2PYB5_SODAK|nr:hypothetical protein SODALDRAFT_331650 [Sodiomyces alkalinus F11]ROT39533.1 hypothetical protein SODALDRAFT_331650 [Sodiomyces alkalinus F11]
MDGELDDDLLRQLASGNSIDDTCWPALLDGILATLDKIAHNDFPIPNLPPPRQPVNPLAPTEQQSTSPILSSSIEPVASQPSSSSQDADKENNQPPTSAPKPDSDAPPSDATATATATTTTPPATASAPTSSAAPGTLPPQIQDMLTEINQVLRDNFSKHPPHTIQRLAELILEPRRHYRHLAPYLHAVDRVVHVTSGSNVYPLPTALPDMSSMSLLSNGVTNPAAAISWGNPTTINTTAAAAAAAVGSDEALGGALLTPIPWLTRRPSPHADSASSSPAPTQSAGDLPQPHHQPQHAIRTESTETIEGPNGMGSIETVSVSINGNPSSMAAAAAAGASAGAGVVGVGAGAGAGAGADNTGLRPITQGELLRQEQQRGVVPVNQLARQAEEVASHHAQAAAAAIAAARRGASAGDAHGDAAAAAATDPASSSSVGDQTRRPGDREDDDDDKGNKGEHEADVPHARGPGEIGVNDLGPQSASTMRYVEGVGGHAVEMQGIDVEAAVGRKADPARTPASASAGTAEQADEADDAAGVGRQAQESSTGRAEDDAVSDAESETSQKREAGEELQGSPVTKKVKEEGEGAADAHGDGDGDGDETMKETTEGETKAEAEAEAEAEDGASGETVVGR